MKKTVILLFILCLFLNSCGSGAEFIESQSGRITSTDGTEYVLLGTETTLCHFGEMTFAGKIEGEKASFTHLSTKIKTGMFSLEEDSEKNILVRNVPDSEFRSYYRKASLPPLDLSPENCIRLEYITGPDDTDISHLNCGKGITDKSIIEGLISAVKQGKNAEEAGLYDAVRKPDGTLDNCYTAGIVYGFFSGESNLAVKLVVTSFDDKAYSITVDNAEMVLPAEWLAVLTEASK